MARRYCGFYSHRSRHRRKRPGLGRKRPGLGRKRPGLVNSVSCFVFAASASDASAFAKRQGWRPAGQSAWQTGDASRFSFCALSSSSRPSPRARLCLTRGFALKAGSYFAGGGSSSDLLKGFAGSISASPQLASSSCVNSRSLAKAFHLSANCSKCSLSDWLRASAASLRQAFACSRHSLGLPGMGGDYERLPKPSRALVAKQTIHG